jgi:hypothetical protein
MVLILRYSYAVTGETAATAFAKNTTPVLPMSSPLKGKRLLPGLVLEPLLYFLISLAAFLNHK